jgi:integrase/recombinase XerD
MKNNKISKINENAIEKFINFRNLKIDNQNTLDNDRNYLRMFFSKTTKKYNEITLNDTIKILSDFKPTTSEVIKNTIKMFYRYYKKPKIYKNLPSNSKVLSRNSKGEEAVLTPKEIDKIIEAPKELRDRAIIETFITTGIRNNELRNLKFSDVNINDPITTWIKVKRTKTENNNTKLNIPIVPNPENPTAKTPIQLRNWYKINENLPRDTYLFYSKARNNYGNKLSRKGLQEIVENARKNAKINKKVTPHIFKHTSATYDGQFLSENMLRQKYWTPRSNMAYKYCHHNEKQLETQLLKIAGYTQEEQDKGRICENCHESNNITDDYCKKCNYPISPKKLTKTLEEALTIQQETKKMTENFYREKRKLDKNIKGLNEEIKQLKEEWDKQYFQSQEERQHMFNMIPKEKRKEFFGYIKKGIEEENKQLFINLIMDRIKEQKPKLSDKQLYKLAKNKYEKYKKIPQAKPSKTMIERTQRLEKYIKNNKSTSRAKEQS